MTKTKIILASAALAMAMAAPAGAHPVKAKAAVAAAAKPDPAEVKAVDATITAVYAVISGPAGQARDWDKMRGLFTPGARLAPIGKKGATILSVEDYISKSGPFLTEKGFTERELGRRIEIYGQLAHVWSAYDGAIADQSVKVRGINSFQLVKGEDGKWRVYSILWQQEHDGAKLPKDMEK